MTGDSLEFWFVFLAAPEWRVYLSNFCTRLRISLFTFQYLYIYIQIPEKKYIEGKTRDVLLYYFFSLVSRRLRSFFGKTATRF